MTESIAIIGECMLELSNAEVAGNTDDNLKSINYGGDTLNTAVYLARLGAQVQYITALGDDAMSTWMLEQWQQEGVGCELVKRFDNSVPGLYMIQLDDQGERSFLYWRKNSPATRIFDREEYTKLLFNKIKSFEWVYLSGITLALYNDDARQRLFSHLRSYREQGGKIAFDNNYRPAQWGDVSEARQAFSKIYQITDLALPSVEDEGQLWENETVDDVISRLQAFGVNEMVLKMGERNCLVIEGDESSNVETIKVNVVDTTAAGDSFNAAYINTRMNGGSAVKAARAGHELASTVIQHRGAIIPANEMRIYVKNA